jgi:cytochrome P450 family 110
MKRPPVVKMSRWLQLYHWIMEPLDFLDACADRYGECFNATLGNYNNFMIFSHPEAIEQIFTASAHQFDSGRGNFLLQRTLGDNSVLLLDGDRHKRQRQLMMPPFHGERMRAYGQLICQITEQITQQWQLDQPFIMRSSMQEISLKVILRAVFGIEEGSRYQQIHQRLNQLLELTATRFGFAIALFPFLQWDLGAWSLGGRFNRLLARIDELLYAEIHDRRNQPEQLEHRTDILSLLMAARDEAGQPMSDAELRDELITLLLAGHETTATALSWAFYWIHSLPDVKAKLLAELETLNGEMDAGAIARLPYLNAVCCETLRIYPVAFITSLRIANHPVQVMGYDFEPEDYLAPCIYLTHHREDLYPNPKQFRPERFIERQFSPYEFLPFGGSNRRCIGAAFAMYEMKLVLATVLTQYELKLAESGPIHPIRRGVTLSPQGGIRMVMTGYRPARGSVRETVASV